MSWRRILLIGSVIAAAIGALSVYVGYRVVFRKNPEAVREIHESEKRQRDLDALFDAPPSEPAR